MRPGTFVDDFNQLLVNVHPSQDCEGEHCVIHNPSDHAMRDFPLQWREAGPLDIKPSHFERICPHGIGHPDPDSAAYLKNVGENVSIHGCDGCCFG